MLPKENSDNNNNNKNISRRQFVKNTAALTGLAIPYIITSSSVLGKTRSASAYVAPSNRINMALIGCGGMGSADMNSLIHMDDVQFLAVCDPDTSHRNTAKQTVENYYAQNTKTGTYKGCTAYNDFREVLARDDIDAIVQATPDHWHALVVVAAARAGKDIYGEKPLSLTIAQGRVMSDTIARYGRVFQTGSQQRSDSRFRFACELVRNGRIGRVHNVTCGLPTTPTTSNYPPIPVPPGFDYNLWLGPAPWAPYCENRTHWNFRWILDYSGGQVTDWGAHHIDIAHWGLGVTETGPVEVEGVGEFPQDGLYNAATNYTFNCKYRGGVNITVTNNFENGVKWEGSDGWVFVNRSRIDAEPKSLLTETIYPSEVNLYHSPGHHRNFLDCVKSRKAPIAPIEQAHRTISVAHLGNIAMLLGRKVNWNPDTETFIDDPTAQRMKDRAMREPWRL